MARTKRTGSIFKYKGSKFYWIAYTSGGKRYFESSESTRKGDAQELLTSKLGDISHGIAVTPKVGKKTLGAGIQAFIDDLKMNGRKSVGDATRKTKRLLDYFKAECRMSQISGGSVEAYKAHRLNENAAPATVNRELAALRRAFQLAIRSGDLVAKPYIGLLTEHNTRTGFLERPEFDDVLEHLPKHLHPPVKFAFVTGWRFKSEILSLRASQVDLVAGVVRLEPGKTKDGAGRTFNLTADLRELLEKQLTAIGAFEREDKIVRHVFHRPNGQPIRDMRGAWKSACEAAGYPGKLFHDFRRTAVRNLERAGVPRSAAMQMVGHKTESVYRRYAIVDSTMLREASERLDVWTTEQKAEAKRAERKRKGQLKRFAANR